MASHNRNPLLQELHALAVQVTGEEVTLVEGESGSSWSWNWKDRLISVSPDFLDTRSADVCRAILLHECAHCAITRIHHLLEASTRRLYQDVLNVLEDLRIEAWLCKTLPGCASWLRTANGLLFRPQGPATWPANLQLQFLRALLEAAHNSRPPEGPHPAVLQALAETREAVLEQTACHPAEAVGRAAAGATLNAQQRMLAIFQSKIRHVWERLVAIDESQGRQRITTITSPSTRSYGATLDKRLSRSSRHGGSFGNRSGKTHGASYLIRQQRLAPHIDRLAGEFLQLFATTARDTFQPYCNSGARLNMRLAMQSQADPRWHDKIWLRRQHHSRFDPLVVLMLDTSASMNGEKFDAALDGIVLLSEVCLRAGLPMALWTFNHDVRQILRPHGQSDSSVRRQSIDRLRSQCGGGTDMDFAFIKVFSSPEIHQFTHPLVLVLGDGCPDDLHATRTQIARFDAAGVPIVGLGIGPETTRMNELFKSSVIGLSVRDVTPALCATLRETLHHMVPATPRRRAA